MIVIALTAMLALAAEPPLAVRTYASCVERNLKAPSEESNGFDEALDLAKASCGNLRPAAVAAVRAAFDRDLRRMGDDPESAAQAYLDILVETPLEAWWREGHGE